MWEELRLHFFNQKLNIFPYFLVHPFLTESAVISFLISLFPFEKPLNVT